MVLQTYTDLVGIEDGYIEGVYKSAKFPGKPDRSDTRFNFDTSTSTEENVAQRSIIFVFIKCFVLLGMHLHRPFIGEKSRPKVTKILECDQTFG